jgi:hypothetical protein
MVNTKIEANSNCIDYEYKSHKYTLNVTGAQIKDEDGMITVSGDRVTVTPTKV